jgi:hypothetical protein
VTQTQTREFRKRLKRIDRIHRRGGGFEARGTLGQSFYTRQARRAARPVLKPALAMVLAVVTVKAVAAASMEEGAYLARVEALQAGSIGERAAAFVMAPDPVSQSLARLVAPLFASE